MADLGAHSKSARRPDKVSKVNRILNLFEISRPNKGLQRTNSLPNGKRRSLSSSDQDSGVWSARNSFRGNRRTPHNSEDQIEENDASKSSKKRTHHHRQIPEELNTEVWKEDMKHIMQDLDRLKEKIEDASEHVLHSDTEMEIAIRQDEDVFEDSDTFCDSDRLSMETVFHFSDTAADGNSLTNNDGFSYVTYCDFVRSKSHEEGIQSSIEPLELNNNCSSSADIKPINSNHSLDCSETEPIDNSKDRPILETIEWWKHKSFVQIANENAASPQENLEIQSKYPGSSLQGRFRKNNRSARRRTGILKRPLGVKELAQRFEGFKEAAESGQTEDYRKSIICEIDAELENMKLDGYEEDFHLLADNLAVEDSDKDVDRMESSVLPAEKQLSEACQQNTTDLFGEIYFTEDLENGFYYLEACNADGKELTKCSVQIERKSIDILSFDRMKTNGDPNILSNDDKMMLVLGYQAGNDSKRNTIYSTTSGESYDDEDSLNSSDLSIPSAARRETFCDQQGVVRIERVAPYVHKEAEAPYYMRANNYYNPTNEETQEDDTGQANDYEIVRLEHEILFSVPETKKNTIQYIIDEIKCTERKYVADMEKVLVEYKRFLEERCPEQVDVVFGNMEQIFKSQRNFLDALESPHIDTKAVAQTFLEFDDLFRLYPRYFRNTPKANAAIKELGFLIKEKQDKINDKLDLSAYLLTPIQRLGKYKLFLENIIKQLQKEDRPVELVQLALDMVKKYMSKGNDAVALASILHSPLHTKDYGSFISREKFTMIKPKKLEVMVFLFEGVVVFTAEDPKNMEEFVYLHSIRTYDLRIATFDNDNTIQLTDFTKTKRRSSSKYTYVLDTKSPKQKDAWKMQIEDILWKQMKKIKENTLKAYKNSEETPELARKVPRKREHRAKSTGSSVFYVDCDQAIHH